MTAASDVIKLLQLQWKLIKQQVVSINWKYMYVQVCANL